MQMTLEFEGLKELQTAVERLASDAEIRNTNKKILQECADVTEPRMKSHMPESANNGKSGRTGHRPPGHAADNIPKKVTATQAEVGWQLNGDAENWFYMKFVEWGTSKMAPRDFINNTKAESEGDYGRIADQGYQTLLTSKLGG